MNAATGERLALFMAAIVVAAALFAGMQVSQAKEALRSLEQRVTAIRPGGDDAAGAGDGGKRGPGGNGTSATAAAEEKLIAGLREDIRKANWELEGTRPVRGTGDTPEVSAANLAEAVQDALRAMKRESEERLATSTAQAMKAGAVHTFRMNNEHLKLNDEQTKKIEAVFAEESERCRQLLLGQTDHHDAEYQAQAKEIIERTDARVAAILDEEQRKKLSKIGVDYFGPGLDYERRPK